MALTSPSVTAVTESRTAVPLAGAARRRRTAAFIVLCLLPSFVMLVLFQYYPLVSALYHSLFAWNGYNAPQFVGFKNFTQMSSDPALRASVKNIAILAASAVVITLTFPLLAAELVLSLRNVRMFKIYRALLVIPIVVPQLVILLIWQFMYDPSIGIVDRILHAIGLGSPQWLGDPHIALFAIIGIGFPWVAGLNFLLYLAALQNIPGDIHDAVRMDGASAIRRVVSIDLPLVSAQVRLLITLALITVMQTFTQVWVLTQGGPGYATAVPGIALYQQAFEFSNFGYASAIGSAIFLVTLILTLLSNSVGRVFQRR